MVVVIHKWWWSSISGVVIYNWRCAFASVVVRQLKSLASTNGYICNSDRRQYKKRHPFVYLVQESLKSITVMCLVILLRPKIRTEKPLYIHQGQLPPVKPRKSVSNWLRNKYPYVFKSSNASRSGPLPTDISLFQLDNAPLELPPYQE